MANDTIQYGTTHYCQIRSVLTTYLLLLHNSKPRRAVAFDSLEIPCYLNSFLNLTWSSPSSTITAQSGLYLCKAPSYCAYSQEVSYPANNPPRTVVLPWLGACLVAYTLTPGHGSHQTMPRWARTSDSSECLNWPTGPTNCFPSRTWRGERECPRGWDSINLRCLQCPHGVAC